MNYKHVIWDWNGTLLDDVELNHRLLNRLQQLKGVSLSSFEEYRKIFTFPITELYKKAGIFENMESFKELAAVYIKEYEKGVVDCSLQKYAEEVLSALTQNGITNSILTASLENMAVRQLERYSISQYFVAVTGKQDYYASGKSELIETHLKKIGYSSRDTVFVGDTAHDMEIAGAIGCDCVIVSNGHQDIDGLAGETANIAADLKDAAERIFGIHLHTCS